MVVKTIQKEKGKNVVSLEDSTVLLVDELVKLKQKIDEVQPLLDRYEEVKKQLAAKASSIPSDEEVTFTGTMGKVVFSKPRCVTEVDKEAVLQYIGMKTFVQVAKVGITDLRKYLTEDEMNMVSQKKPGGRVLKAVVPNN